MLREPPAHRPRPSEAPPSAPTRTGAAPHPAPAVRAPAAAAPLAGPGLPGPVSSFRSRCSNSSSRRRRHGPGAGALRHFRLPLHPNPPAPAGGDVTRHSRRGGDATWTPGFPRPRDAPGPVRSWLPRSPAPRGDHRPCTRASAVPQPTLATIPFSRAPPRASAPQGGAWDRFDPCRGT